MHASWVLLWGVNELIPAKHLEWDSAHNTHSISLGIIIAIANFILLLLLWGREVHPEAQIVLIMAVK